MKKILVVDDEQDILELISIILSEKDTVVYKAKDGLTAIDIARKEKPDLILLDVMMPEMDGWEVLKILKIDEIAKDIPVVILTCKTETKDKVLGIQEGAVDYITKPFDPDYLHRRINEIIKENRKE
ncbi:MAG: hypothetical protein B5M53_02890 [Candidatus Cloacimonas sp. 4484_209]|nr:MAG: hypothetical protein B5M53_02890 [Candidatus Cloacimonas sp. 4484_209]